MSRTTALRAGGAGSWVGWAGDWYSLSTSSLDVRVAMFYLFDIKVYYVQGWKLASAT